MGRKSTWNINRIQEFLASTNSECVLLSKEVTNLKTPLEFQCKCGNHFYRKFHNVRNQKSYYCISCSRQHLSNNYKLSHDDYLNRLNKKGIKSIIPLEKYQTAKTKILHKCTVCNYEWQVAPSNILSGYGCPCCNGGHCIQGYNDIATTNHEMYQLLKDKNDAYNHTEQSNISLKFICPHCGNEINMSPATLYKRGLSCRICSDGISRPNKFMEQILISSNIEYETEFIFSWSNNKRYDFYIPKYNAIIEVMGNQHYNTYAFDFVGGRSLEEEQENDNLKEQLALQNGISKYFRLDFRYSEYEYMKNSFLNSDIPMFLNINVENIDFNSCYQNTLKSKMILAIDLWNQGYKVDDISKTIKVSIGTVIRYLHNGNDAKLCKYNGLNKEVICLNTGEIFNSIKSAKEKYSASNIGSCCKVYISILVLKMVKSYNGCINSFPICGTIYTV